ncbi:Latent glucokinase ycfX [Cronobacter sakazakii 696]|nr:Latent glucokinase ycfX [Cronobacter sakazakii 696]
MRIDNDANCFALSEAWDDEFSAYPVVMGLISSALASAAAWLLMANR